LPKSKRQQQFDRYDAFVAYVVDLCGRDRKARADLRSGLGRPLERCDYMHRYLVPRLPTPERRDWYDDRRRAHYTVASLLAARPPIARDADAAAADENAPEPVDWWTRPDLGMSLGWGVNKQVLKANTTEDDLHLMVRQSTEAMQQRLPALTRHLLGRGLTIDWSVLLDDLSRWNSDRDRIATRWLDSYFRVRDREETADQKPDDDTNEQKENL
jgi:CRISPR system Cascade subunit CasB